MDLLLEAVPALAGLVLGSWSTLMAVRWRKRLPRVDEALETIGVTDHAHVYDRMINDGRGWKCKCGARAPKKG